MAVSRRRAPNGRQEFSMALCPAGTCETCVGIRGRAKRYIVIVSQCPLKVCGLLLFVVASSPSAERGWLLGSVGFFGNGGFVDHAKNSKLVIACKGQKVIVQTDELGDYSVQLGHCEYRLIEVVAPSGYTLTISPRQARTFTIRDGGRTRFDVMLTPATPPTPNVIDEFNRSNGPKARMNPAEAGPGSPRVSWAQATEGPTVKVVFSVDDTMELPAFKATCDRPCNNVMSEAAGNYEPVPLSFEHEPNSVGLTLRSPRPLGAGVRVLWVIRSLDERSIAITDFRILEIGEVPAELRH